MLYATRDRQLPSRRSRDSQPRDVSRSTDESSAANIQDDTIVMLEERESSGNNPSPIEGKIT